MSGERCTFGVRFYFCKWFIFSYLSSELYPSTKEAGLDVWAMHFKYNTVGLGGKNELVEWLLHNPWVRA